MKWKDNQLKNQSIPQVVNRCLDSYQCSEEPNLIPFYIDANDEHFQNHGFDHILDSLLNPEEISLFSTKESSEMDTFNKKILGTRTNLRHRITTAAEMKNHPLTKSSNGFISEGVCNETDENEAKSQKHSPNVEYQKSKIKKLKFVKFELNECEEECNVYNNIDIEPHTLNKKTNSSLNISNEGDCTREIPNIRNGYLSKTETDVILEGDNRFLAKDETNIFPSTTENDHQPDAISYLQNMITKVNTITKGKKVLSLLNGELILDDKVFSSQKENELCCNVHHNVVPENFFDETIIVKEDSKNEFNLPAIVKNKLLLPKKFSNIFSTKDGSKLNYLSDGHIWPMLFNKTFRVPKCVKTVMQTRENLLLLNPDQSGLYNNSDSWVLNESNNFTLMSDSSTLTSETSRLTISTFENLKETHPRSDGISSPERSGKFFSTVLGCCSECKVFQNINKSVVYNVPSLKSNEYTKGQRSKDEDDFLKCEKAVVSTEVEPDPASQNLRNKESVRKVHFSDSTECVAYESHKKVFKKFNPRSLLLFQTTTSRNRIGQPYDVKESDKSPRILVKDGGEEILEGKNIAGFKKETYGDEDSLISHRNKSADNLFIHDSMWPDSSFSVNMKENDNLVSKCDSDDNLKLLKTTDLLDAARNLPSKIVVLGRHAETAIRRWSARKIRSETKISMRKFYAKINKNT
ncbi:uncharacterized protein CDAR_285431 [Caerostris darwini]|uniref:Uncharacterized protein n=1 Tax=Caerostris darwini TaxID=1538125 RepID=A0AAV4RER1_9ARAC|nr:uncharacterized protein CDAR_285431 [Caerostris darwini]